MPARHPLWAIANLLIGRYGAAATERAGTRAETARQSGDLDGATTWSGVRDAIAGRGASSTGPLAAGSPSAGFEPPVFPPT